MRKEHDVVRPRVNRRAKDFASANAPIASVPGRSSAVATSSSSPREQLAHRLVTIRNAVPVLERALARGDYHRVVAVGAELAAALEAAKLLLGAVARSDAARDELRELIEQATPMLARVPTVSRAELDEAIDGGSRSHSDAAATRWRTANGFSSDHHERLAREDLASWFRNDREQVPLTALGMTNTTVAEPEDMGWAADSVGVARKGVAQARDALPHAGEIQQRFGRHSISSVRALVGGAAAQATKALEVAAYALGDRVAFRETPDLHTAAHEAAHVVQQRAGLGNGSDLEEHADRVADAVVAGESAEALLDAVVARSAAPVIAVQAKKQPLAPYAHSRNAPVASNLVVAEEYVKIHAQAIVDAFAASLSGSSLPRPHQRLSWADSTAAKQVTVSTIESYLLRGPVGVRFKQLLYPRNVEHVVDEARAIEHGKRGSAVWRPAVGDAMAAQIESAMNESITRMGMRLRVQLDNPVRVVTSGKFDGAEHGVDSSSDELTSLVRSTAFDEIILDALTHARVRDHGKQTRRGRDDTPGDEFQQGIRVVEYEWLGMKDPTLWNWIRVTSVPDPKPEEVAHTLWTTNYNDPREYKTDLAPLIVSAPPFFGVPKETARRDPRAAAYEPKLWFGDVTVTDARGLAASSIADEVSLAQVPRVGKADANAVAYLQRIEIQLHDLRDRMKLLPSGHAGGAALEFVARRRSELSSDSQALARWSGVVREQASIVEIATIDCESLWELVDPKQPADIVTPIVRRVLDAYFDAAMSSHLVPQAQKLLADARHLKASISLELAKSRVRVAEGEAAELRSVDASAKKLGVGPRGTRAPDAIPALRSKLTGLQVQAVRAPLDEQVVEELSIEAEELALRLRLRKLATTVAMTARQAEAAGVLDHAPQGAPSIGTILERLRTNVVEWIALADSTPAASTAPGADPKKLKQIELRHRRDNLAAVEIDIRKFERATPLQSELRYIERTIADETLRRALVGIIIEVAALAATGQLVNAGAAVVRGVYTATRIQRAAALARSGRALVAGVALEKAAHAGATTVVQGAMGRPVGAADFAENLIGEAFVAAVLKPFKSISNLKVAIPAVTWKQLAINTSKYLARTGLHLSAETVANVAAHSVVTGDLSSPTAQTLIAQGMAFAAGRLIAQRMATLHARIETSAQRKATRAFVQLGSEARRLSAEARSKGAKLSPSEAIDLLARERELRLRERALLDGAGTSSTDPAKQASAAELEVDAGFVEVPLRLAGLHSVLGDRVYQGTRDQIARAYDAATKLGLRAELQPAVDGFVLRVGAREIRIHETPTRHSVAPEVDGPVRVDAPTPRHDSRRLAAPAVRQLSRTLGVEVVVDATLTDGVLLHYARRATKRGIDIAPTVVRIGPRALYADVVIHKATIGRITKYNGLLGQLRGLWARLTRHAKSDANPYPKGTRGWETFEELHKLETLISDRRKRWDPNLVDRRTLDEEIAYLEGWAAHHREVIRSIEETLVPGSGEIARPDVGAVNKLAAKKGLRLPGPTEGVMSEWYYYRTSQSSKTGFELVLSPNAPLDPDLALRAIKEPGQPVRFEKGGTRRLGTDIDKTWTFQQLYDHMMQNEGLKAFVSLGVKLQVTTRKQVNDLLREQLKFLETRNSTITDETLRSKIKDSFREEMSKKIGVASTPAESWKKMREELASLDNADRGNLVEEWYQRTYAQSAVQHAVAKSQAGERETRKADLFVAATGEAIEVKDVQGSIDQAQLDSYILSISSGSEFNGVSVKSVRYVFVSIDGLRANIAKFYRTIGQNKHVSRKISISYFDSSGEQHSLVGLTRIAEVARELGVSLEDSR